MYLYIHYKYNAVKYYSYPLSEGTTVCSISSQQSQYHDIMFDKILVNYSTRRPMFGFLFLSLLFFYE